MSTLKANAVETLDGRGQSSITFENIAQLKASGTVKVGQYVRTTGYYASGDGGGNDYEIVAAATGTDDGGSFIDIDSGVQARGLFPNSVGLSTQFGAMADGVTDDYLSIQNLLNSGLSELVIDGGDSVITNDLEISTQGSRVVTSKSSRLVCATVDMTALHVKGHDITVSVNVNGGDVAHAGVRADGVSSNYLIERCEIEDFYSTTRQGFGIISRSGLGGVIKNNFVRNIGSQGDGVIGNADGISRGVQYLPDIIPTMYTFIENNRIHNIYGEEGGCISVQNSPSQWDGVFPYPDAKAIIRNNYVENFSRRGIKIQASFVEIRGNQIVANEEPTTGTKSFAIASYASDDLVIEDNSLNLGGIFSGITCQGLDAYTVKNIQVKGNTINSPNVVFGFMTFINSLSMSENIFKNVDATSRAIAVGDSKNVSISNNKFVGGVTTEHLIEITSTCSDVVIAYNYLKDTACKRFVETRAINTVILGNTSVQVPFELTPIRGFDPDAAGSVARNNVFLLCGQTGAAFFGALNYEDFGNLATV